MLSLTFCLQAQYLLYTPMLFVTCGVFYIHSIGIQSNFLDLCCLLIQNKRKEPKISRNKFIHCNTWRKCIFLDIFNAQPSIYESVFSQKNHCN